MTWAGAGIPCPRSQGTRERGERSACGARGDLEGPSGRSARSHALPQVGLWHHRTRRWPFPEPQADLLLRWPHHLGGAGPAHRWPGTEGARPAPCPPLSTASALGLSLSSLLSTVHFQREALLTQSWENQCAGCVCSQSAACSSLGKLKFYFHMELCGLSVSPPSLMGLVNTVPRPLSSLSRATSWCWRQRKLNSNPHSLGTIQWSSGLDSMLPLQQGARVGSQVRELRSHLLFGLDQKTRCFSSWHLPH